MMREGGVPLCISACTSERTCDSRVGLFYGYYMYIICILYALSYTYNNHIILIFFRFLIVDAYNMFVMYGNGCHTDQLGAVADAFRVLTVRVCVRALHVPPRRSSAAYQGFVQRYKVRKLES
jgi:hypothetical protein